MITELSDAGQLAAARLAVRPAESLPGRRRCTRCRVVCPHRQHFPAPRSRATSGGGATKKCGTFGSGANG